MNLTKEVNRIREASIKTYRDDPGLLKEHYGIEEVVLAGGYGYRQVMELVQNGADAVLEACQQGGEPPADNRVRVILRNSRLYVANTGAPLSKEGLEALLHSHSSPKCGNRIGRFGLGFKSLLCFGGQIDLFTKSNGAVYFDPEQCRRELRETFRETKVPGLRLAWGLEESERNGDPVLDDLAWAETIVRAEIKAEGFEEHIRHEIESFPAEFLLFLPVRLLLELDSGNGSVRELRLETNGEECTLHAGQEQSRWRVVSREVAINDQRAIDDATHVHARDSVTVVWAIPLEGKQEAGCFWAFFPTKTPTYLPGILNAPWKLNSDRNAIIAGEWNTALMCEAAQLVVETLPSLSTREDPGRPLDAFPRQLERKDEDAAPLVEAIWSALKSAAVVPDATGNLRMAKELWRHPRDNAELAKQWQALASDERRAELVNASCYQRQRASRLNELAERLKSEGAELPNCHNLSRRDARDWFDAVASAETDKAVEVLKLVEAYANDCIQSEWNQVRHKLKIIPTDAGQLVTADQAVFAPEGTHVPDGRHPVSRALFKNQEAKRILEYVMKVGPLDDSVWKEALNRALLDLQRTLADQKWRRFWEMLRAAPENVRQRFASQNASRIRVRRRGGNWVLADNVLLPGALVSANDTSENQKVLVDPTVHRDDGPLLQALGVCDFPDGVVHVSSFDELGDWLWHCRLYYQQNVNRHASWGYLQPSGLLNLPKGWRLLPCLRGFANAKLTAKFLERLGRQEFPDQVQFGRFSLLANTQINVSHPLPWSLLKHGLVQVGNETVRLAAIVARRTEPALAKLPDWQQLRPALEKLEGAIPKVEPSSEDIQNLWQALIKLLVKPAALADDSLRELWAGAAKDGVVPSTLPCTEGQIPLHDVFVTGSPDLARRARTNGRVVVTLDAHALQLWLEKGAKDLASLISPQWTELTGPEALLVATVPDLVEVMQPEAKDSARCQLVTGLKLNIVDQVEPVPCLMWENKLFLDWSQLAELSRADKLKHLLDEIAPAGWLRCAPEEALRILGDAQVEARRANVAKGNTLAKRLLLAVGNRVEPLRQVLGHLANMDFVQQCLQLQLAELVLTHLGPVTLVALKDSLKAEGLNPPSRWNTAEAREFVASLGFPEEFATSAESRPEPEEVISGPIDLPPLHDFQKEVLDGIKALIDLGTGRRRAVISLPTGAGKTRVTVEAAVRLVLEPECDPRSVLWIAQTDELCEQAVQAFRQVWINLGAKGTNLRIIRLWGGNPNSSAPEPGKPIVVIASIQTLYSRMGANTLKWLQKPGLVVVDECHHAITPSYTNLLRWLDAEAPNPGEPLRNEPPILGLSATPFRTDDDECQRLARRFDRRWLPKDQEQLYQNLLKQGVLAEVKAELLESGVGVDVELIEKILSLLDKGDGIELENQLEELNKKLAKNKHRNEWLMECIRNAQEKSILFFANSVSHAEEMAARLNLEHIPAAAVSGNTATVARRYFLDRFQRGEIRVLCNHTVLSTGFDAPKTDMIIIARQVSSPVRYMQMVGRGLRGPKNGGTPACRIVTVFDNLGKFQERHPYHYCKRFFVNV